MMKIFSVAEIAMGALLFVLIPLHLNEGLEILATSNMVGALYFLVFIPLSERIPKSDIHISLKVYEVCIWMVWAFLVLMHMGAE